MEETFLNEVFSASIVSDRFKFLSSTKEKKTHWNYF